MQQQFTVKLASPATSCANLGCISIIVMHSPHNFGEKQNKTNKQSVLLAEYCNNYCIYTR